MNQQWAFAFGGIFGIGFGTGAVEAWGWWALPLVLVFTLAGIAFGERFGDLVRRD